MSDQSKLGFAEITKSTGPVECLGQTFESDESRREYYLKLLAEKLKDPDFRKTPGFPKGSDEDILRLSDPPYYTACPNPFLPEFVGIPRQDGASDEYHRIPFCSDVSEGKGGKLYKAHTYHTKVPPQAIARYILHYTDPGDVVLDAFAGSGMTGLAAALCASPDASLRQAIEGDSSVVWGKRRAVLVDLSPFATFLAHNLNTSLNADVFEEEATKLITQTRSEVGSDFYGEPEANYILWSQSLLCPACAVEFSFLDVAITEAGTISSRFTCPSCKATITKGQCERKLSTEFDALLGEAVTQNHYAAFSVMRVGGQSLESITRIDLKKLKKDWGQYTAAAPVIPMMFIGEKWGDMYRSGYHAGVSHVHQFWTPRNLAVLSALWRRAERMAYPNQMRFVLTSFMVKTGSRMHNVGMKHGRINLAGQIFNTLQIPSVAAERNLFELARGKIADLVPTFELAKHRDYCAVSTGSAAATTVPDNSIDYIFVDPPFGQNIMYSEMSFLYEAWLGVFTARQTEAIVSSSQEKSLDWYRAQMTDCFRELHRVLKPGRWITIAFHNSRNEVWNALQEALRKAGFVIADVRILDKGQGTFKQMTTAGAVEKDLAISAYKPSRELDRCAELNESSEDSCWVFIREHLSRLPVAVSHDSALEVLQERVPQLLFDRMVAYHVVRNRSIPIAAGEFYEGLNQRFPTRDGMYFLQGQVTEYDRMRTTVSEIRQLTLFVSDEASATQWLRQQLHNKPQSFRALQPQFMQQVRDASWLKHEKKPELRELLSLNFFEYDGKGPVPSQIHGYLSTNFSVLRNLDNEDARLKAKAVDRWYVPDPKKEGDLEKLRLRTLLKEFEEYRTSTKRKIKQFRTEAVRAGFKHCYDEQDYQTIVDVAAKLAEEIIQQDEKLLMYYDVATMRLGV